MRSRTSSTPSTPPAIKSHPRGVRLLREPAVEDRAGVKKTTLYRDIREGLFVQPIRRGQRWSAWVEFEVDQVLGARASGANDDDIRALVERLHAARGVTPGRQRRKWREASRRGAALAGCRRGPDTAVRSPRTRVLSGEQ